MRLSLRQLFRALERQHWRLDRRSSGHVLCYPPDRTRAPVLVAGTPSDHRALRNALARLRRSGAEV